MVNQTADDVLFVLENDTEPWKRIRGDYVLQAVDDRLSDRLRLGPEGTTKADAWIARHGDPIASTEAAMLLIRSVLGVPVAVPVSCTTSKGYSSARIGESRSVTVSGGLAVALCGAAMAFYLKEQR